MKIGYAGGVSTHAELSDVSTPHVAADIATDAIESAKIKDANVIAAKLATDAVETAKILNANVTAAKLQDTSASGEDKQTLTLTETKVGSGTTAALDVARHASYRLTNTTTASDAVRRHSTETYTNRTINFKLIRSREETANGNGGWGFMNNGGTLWSWTDGAILYAGDASSLLTNKKASTATNTACAITYVQANDIVIEWKAGKIQLFINGALCSTSTTNIPTAACEVAFMEENYTGSPASAGISDVWNVEVI